MGPRLLVLLVSLGAPLTVLAMRGWTADASISPACVLANAPCPLPPWEPTWILNRSTMLMTCNNTGLIDPVAASRFGVITLDWTSGDGVWGNTTNFLPRDAPCGLVLLEQAAQIKAVQPSTRVMVYRNMELALEAYESERAAMYDADRSGWFLHYTDGKGRKNGTIYNEVSIPLGPQGTPYDQVGVGGITHSPDRLIYTGVPLE